MTMMVIDPVCGMRIDPDDAAATVEHGGEAVYFCSEACRDTFVADPEAIGTADRLSAEELAERTGVDVRRIRTLADLGILTEEAGTFARHEVMRARTVTHLASTGIEPEALAAAMASGHLTLGYLESAGRRHPRAEATFAATAERIGLTVETLEEIIVAFGLPRPQPDDRVRAEDLEAIESLAVLFEVGISAADVERMGRVWAENTRRIAQYLPHYFHATVEERFRSRGLGDNQAYEAAIREVGLRIGRSGEDLLGWLFRRHSETFLTEHQYGHVEAALEDAGVRRREARQLEAAVFADLSGYTELTEASGDEVAAEVSLALARLVAEVATAHGGATVKLLGDGALLHFPDAGDAVRASLAIVDAAPARGLPQAHVGVNAGPMLYEGGDYFGRTVNLASRIASHAEAGEVHVGEGVAGVVAEDGFRLRDLGEVELKGIARPVRIFEASRG